MPDVLPIDAVLPEVRDAVRDGNVALVAPTGAGKTTRVPPALRDVVDGTILVLEPRRVAARAAATRMAAEDRSRVGGPFGYQVRFERQVGPDTRVIVCTEGILLRRLQGDPFLEGVGAVVLDEVHERSLNADLALAAVRQVQREVRPDLRLVAMSATLDVEAVAGFLDARVVESRGRSFPVDVTYLDRPDDRRLGDRVAAGVARVAARTDGDILVFLPGAREIGWAQQALATSDLDVVPLHGRLPPGAQDAALQPGARRRVVLATNVAETSVTIPGVTAVVDTGLVRRVRHDPDTGLDRLVTEDISVASAEQRAGRAGRTAPGVCLRLWTATDHARRPAHDDPEVRRADLAATALQLRAWGEPDPASFPWFEAPRPEALAAADALLRDLGAVDGTGLTPVGEAMAKLPVHPRLGRTLVAAHRAGRLDDVATAAALLGDRLPFRRTRPPRHTSDSDLDDLVEAVARRGAWGWVPRSDGALARARQGADQLRRLARSALGPQGHDDAPAAHAWLAGWPDRLAHRRADGGYTLASGRGATLHPESAVHAAWLVAVEVVDAQREAARIHLAVAVDPTTLEAPEAVEATYDPERDRVIGARRARWGSIVLAEQEGVPLDDATVAATLADAAAAHPRRVLPDDRDTTRLLARLRHLAHQRPDLDLPPTDEARLARLGPQLVPRARSLAACRGADWKGALLGRLSWDQRQALDRLVPETLDVPSGRSVRLDYPDEGPPVLAVRMQELFGLDATPTVAGAPVMLHLLAPNGRPQQITDDLPGFWDRIWPQVRAELRGRYPKHPWPEDPRTASPWRPGRRRR